MEDPVLWNMRIFEEPNCCLFLVLDEVQDGHLKCISATCFTLIQTDLVEQIAYKAQTGSICPTLYWILFHRDLAVLKCPSLGRSLQSERGWGSHLHLSVQERIE